MQTVSRGTCECDAQAQVLDGPVGTYVTLRALECWGRNLWKRLTLCVGGFITITGVCQHQTYGYICNDGLRHLLQGNIGLGREHNFLRNATCHSKFRIAHPVVGKTKLICDGNAARNACHQYGIY